MKVALLINPIAGYGFYSNLKDTISAADFDRDKSISLKAGDIFLSGLDLANVTFTVPSGIMGQDLAVEHHCSIGRTVKVSDWPTSARDTEAFVRSLSSEDCDLLVFVGGDGTARCIQRTIARNIPVLGVPAGLKMYSGVYAINPEKAAIAVNSIISGDIVTAQVDILDLDENMEIVNYGTVLGISSQMTLQGGKTEYAAQGIDGIVEYVTGNMEENTYYIFGTGSTCKSIENILGYDADPLCIDIYIGKSLLKSDASEADILSIGKGSSIQLIMSPLGGQGFLFGHGNRQITSRVIEKIGFENILVVSSQEKLSDLSCLYAYMPGAHFPDFIRVLYGYGRFRVIRLVS
ncbi:MAG: ATP-NAD kinase family protein [Thermoplasmata archaeon]